MLDDVAPLLRRLAYRDNLTEDEVSAALNTVGAEDSISDTTHSDGLYFLALTFGLMAKGPTADELHGFTRSIIANSFSFGAGGLPPGMVDVSGTGGDSVKTLNVGAATTFVLAAAGIPVAKQATRGYTGLVGSADVFQAMGLDPFSLRPDQALECLRQTGLTAIYTPALSPAFGNRMAFLGKLRSVGLTYPTPWHLVSWVHSPFPLSYRLYGVYYARFIQPIAEVFRRVSSARVWVVHGVDGLDEVSTLGRTIVSEVHDGKITKHELTPEMLGVSRVSKQDLEIKLAEYSDPQATADARQEGRSAVLNAFLRVLYGEDEGPKADLVSANAGTVLYLAGQAKDVRQGVEQAKLILRSGAARRKVEQVALYADGGRRLQEWRKRVGL